MNKKPPFSTKKILVYSLTSYGLYGLLGMRDIKLKRGFFAFLKIVLFFLGVVFFSISTVESLNITDISFLLQGSPLFRVSLLLFLFSFLFMIAWEIIDIYWIWNHSYEKKYNLTPWKGEEKIKSLLLFTSFLSFLGFAWFFLKKPFIGTLRLLFTFFCVFLIFFYGVTLNTFFILSLGMVFDSLFGILPLIIERLKNKNRELWNEKEIPLQEKKKIISKKNKFLTIFLLFSLGKYGLHDFYVGKFKEGFIKILLVISLFFTKESDKYLGFNEPEFNFYTFVILLFSFFIKILLFFDKKNLFLSYYKDKNNKVLLFNK